MADFVGRKLGLPSLSFNPATWGRAFQPQEPAAMSVTVRTGDLISSLEAILPGDRRVLSRPSKTRLLGLLILAFGVACLALPTVLQRDWSAKWLQQAGITCFIFCLLFFFFNEHTVLHFTAR